MPHISVCICTYKRPNLLRLLLNHMREQDTGGLFTFSIVVVDNDSLQSAKKVVDEFARASSITVIYFLEPQQNIALARNKAIENDNGDFIAFIDDDEFPASDWLCRLFSACNQYEAAGVLGPVKPYFEHEPPEWVRKGGFFDRQAHSTGYRMGFWETRTGNVLFRRNILDGMLTPFRAEFGTGGEDIDFFRRMMEKGNVFIWCDEAPVFELVPQERCNRKYLVRRALMRGGNFHKHPTDRAKNLVKSFLAVPIYTVLLPALFLAGHHHFMRYLVKLCDHGARVLGALGIKLVHER